MGNRYNPDNSINLIRITVFVVFNILYYLETRIFNTRLIYVMFPFLENIKSPNVTEAFIKDVAAKNL